MQSATQPPGTSRDPVYARGWLPTIGQVLWVAIFLGLCLSPQRLELVNADGDPCWHRAQGDWMLNHHALLRVDSFSHTRDAAPIVCRDWLSDVCFAAAGRLLDWNGPVFLAAALIATCFWFLHRFLVGEGCDLVLSTMLVLFAALASTLHWLARPHLMTHLLTAVFACLLWSHERGRFGGVRLFLWLVPLSALWANLHGAFFLSVVLVGMYALGDALAWLGGSPDRRPLLAKRVLLLCGLALSCLAASLLNPYGWHLHAHVLSVMRSPFLTHLTNEFRPPSFRAAETAGFVLLLVLLAGMVGVARPRLRATQVVLIVAWAWLSFRSGRIIPLFALIVTPILAEHGSQWLCDGARAAWVARLRNLSQRLGRQQRSAGAGWVIPLSVVVMLSVAGMGLLPTGIEPSKYPVAASSYLREHPDAVAGNLFNDYDWGGYLMLALPEQKVFVDGRADFYGEAVMRDYLQVVARKPGWEEVLQRYGVGWVLMPVQHPLSAELGKRAGWKRVYGDAVAVVYARLDTNQTGEVPSK